MLLLIWIRLASKRRTFRSRKALYFWLDWLGTGASGGVVAFVLVLLFFFSGGGNTPFMTQCDFQEQNRMIEGYANVLNPSDHAFLHADEPPQPDQLEVSLLPG